MDDEVWCSGCGKYLDSCKCEPLEVEGDDDPVAVALGLGASDTVRTLTRRCPKILTR